VPGGTARTKTQHFVVSRVVDPWLKKSSGGCSLPGQPSASTSPWSTAGGW